MTQSTLLTLPKCPFCATKQTQKPLKSWEYGKTIIKRTENKTIFGSSIKCSRFKCKCGKMFNFYFSVKGKSWTIPKPLQTKT